MLGICTICYYLPRSLDIPFPQYKVLHKKITQAHHLTYHPCASSLSAAPPSLLYIRPYCHMHLFSPFTAPRCLYWAPFNLSNSTDRPTPPRIHLCSACARQRRSPRNLPPPSHPPCLRATPMVACLPRCSAINR